MTITAREMYPAAACVKETIRALRTIDTLRAVIARRDQEIDDLRWMLAYTCAQLAADQTRSNHT